MSHVSSARFFATLSLHPPYTLLILAAIVGIGIWTTTMSPGELDSGLGMLLFAQMFLASSGFLVRARRGHFDPLLAGTANRIGPVVWHWVVSIAPGVAGWICLAGAGYLQGSPIAISALVGARAAALFIVSALAWAAGFGLTRGAAGVGWIAVLFGLLIGRADLLSPSSALTASGWTGLRHTATLVVCPFLLIGAHPALAPEAICAAALSSALFLLIVLRRSGGLDIYLVEQA
jgi:hypothetical protein